MHAAVHGSEAIPIHIFKHLKRFSEECKEQDNPRSGSCQLLEINEYLDKFVTSIGQRPSNDPQFDGGSNAQ